MMTNYKGERGPQKQYGGLLCELGGLQRDLTGPREWGMGINEIKDGKTYLMVAP